MADETAAPETSEEEEATSEETTEQVTEIQEEKAPQAAKDKNWRTEGFTDDKLRTQSERYDTPQSMLENINKLQGEVSRRIKVLGDDATDEDVEKYRKAFGVPDKSDGYEFTAGEGREFTEEDNAVLGAIGEIFHANNVPADAARGVVEAYNGLAQEALALQAKDTVDAHDEAVTELKREWGSEYEANVNLVAQFRERVTDDNFKAFLEEAKLGSGALVADDPAMVRFLARMARATDETELMLGVGGAEGQSLQEQINELEAANIPGSEGYKDPAFQRKLTGLYDKLYGKEPVVGEGQRTL